MCRGVAQVDTIELLGKLQVSIGVSAETRRRESLRGVHFDGLCGRDGE